MYQALFFTDILVRTHLHDYGVRSFFVLFIKTHKENKYLVMRLEEKSLSYRTFITVYRRIYNSQ